MNILFAGCGALGSLMATEIDVRPEGLLVTLIDDEFVGAENVDTSAYGPHHIGQPKVQALAELLYLSKRGRLRSNPRRTTLVGPLPYRLYDLIIDTFDNVEARVLTRGPNTLHVGVSDQRSGLIAWDDQWVVPDVEWGRGENPVCTHELGAQILKVTADAAAGFVTRFISEGYRHPNSVVVLENGHIV